MDNNGSPSEMRKKRKKTKTAKRRVNQPLEIQGSFELTEENATNEEDEDNEVQEFTKKNVEETPHRQKRRSSYTSGSSRSLGKRNIPKTLITAVLEDLNDDVTDEPLRIDTGDRSLAEPVPQVPCRLPPDKVYVERKNGFATTPRVKMFQTLNYAEEGLVDIEYSKSVGTPLEVAILIQKCCRLLYTLCHGLLGGMALLHIILVYGAGDFYSQDSNFVYMYTHYARVYQTLFHILCILCFISALDRCDANHMDLDHLVDLFRYHITTVLILIFYVAILVLTFVTTKWDDWIALSEYRVSIENSSDTAHNLEVWKNLNLFRNIGAISGWMLTAFFPAEDMLYLHLSNMMKYQAVTGRVVPARY